jgi:TP901 family phage tail tape measure protein
MADESRNPEDNFLFRKVQEAARQHAEALGAVNRAIDQIGEQTAETARDTRRMAEASEGAIKRAPPPGTPAPPTPKAAKEIATDTERTQKATEANAKAIREQARLLPALNAGERERARLSTVAAAERVRMAAFEDALAGVRLRRSREEARQLQQDARARIASSAEAVRQAHLGAGPAPAPELAAGYTPGILPRRERLESRPPPGAPSQQEAAEITRASAAERSEIARTARIVGLSGDQFRRHGALTTEFIAAAAKGQVTIRELGYQVGATVGKFAGWTAAATLVYGGLSAISALGAGAVQSQNGVAQLQRVVSNIDTEDAQKQFADLSRHFNVPIKDVADAAYEAGRVFKDQNDIFAATRTTLGAVAVGDLEAAEAGRYLNAIYRGLGGTAQDLAGTLDAANNITNNLGGNTGQLVQGTAGAAAAFRNASKDAEGYVELLAMISTVTLATGRTGAEAGTVVRRGATNILRPENREALKALLPGVTDTTSYTEIIRAAQREIAKPTTTPAKAIEIASKIFTKELASRGGTALLASPTLFARNIALGQPQARAGSVERELAAKLRAVSEQAKAVAISLGALGSAVGRSGALTAVGGLLYGLKEVLNLATFITEQFDRLPSGARTAIVLLAQMRGILAVIRRFDAGQALTGRFPTAGQFLRRDPRRLERAEILSGIGQQRTAVLEEAQRVNREAQRNAFAQVGASERVGRLQTAGASELEIEAARGRVQRLRTEGLDLLGEQEDLAAQHKAVLHQENEFSRRTQRLRRGALEEQRCIASSLGIEYINPTLEQRTYLRPVPIGARPVRRAGELPIQGPARQGAGPGQVGTGATAFVPLTTILAEQGDQYVRAQNSLRDHVVQQRRIAAQLIPGQARLTNVIGTAIAPVFFAGRAIGNAANSLRVLNTTLLGTISPIERLILAALAIYAGYELLDSQVKKARTDLDKLTTIRQESPATLRKQGQEALGRYSLWERFQDLALGLDLGARFGLKPPVQGAKAQRDQEARQRIVDARAIEQSNRKGGDLTNKQIRDRLRKRLADADTPQEIAAAVREAERETAASRTAIRGEGPAAVRNLKLMGEVIRGLGLEASAAIGAAKGAVPKDYKGLLELTGTLLPARIGLLGGGPREAEIQQAEAAIAQARSNAKKSRGGTGMADALSVIQQAQNEILQPAQEELERMIAQAQTPGQQARARRRFGRIVRRVYTGPDEAKGRALIAEENRKQLDAELAAFDARTQRLQSAVTDPVAKARQAASRATQRLARVRDAYNRGLVAIDVLDQAVANNNEALRALSDARVEEARSQRELGTSQFALTHFTDRGAMLQRAVTDARANVNAIRAEGAQQSPGAMRDALRDLNNARVAQAEYARSQAQELLSANAELAKARTDDPVEQAEIEARLARDQERFATTRAERRLARAQTLNARKNVRQARVSKQQELIDFNLEMETITRQEAISQLEALAKTRGIGTQLRHDLKRRIKALKNEGERDTTAFNLGVGDIKLPTVYDVRRGIKAAQAPAAPLMTGSDVAGLRAASVTANVNVVVNDPNAAGAVFGHIDRALRTGVRSRMRTAGVR